MGLVAILGATGTIGKAIATRLVPQGRHVLLIGRNRDKLDTLSSQLSQPSLCLDSIESQSLEEGLTQAARQYDGISAIVNCVGSLWLKPAHQTSDEDFRRVVETNLFTGFAAIRSGSNLMRDSGGSIVLFASAAAEIGIQNHEAIAAAKAGVIGLARSAAATYAPHNIRVNVISPGLIQTELTRHIWSHPRNAEASARMHSLGRLGTPEHVASLATWLLDPENDWITGQVIGVDGGLGHVLPQRRAST